MSLFRRIFSGPVTAMALTLTAGALVPDTASAAAESINCPLGQARREMTSPLPAGWWNTPMVSSLQATRIITLAGRKALQCRYGAAGDIQTYAPPGARCNAVSGGFVCVTAPPAPPAVRTFSTGPLVIRQTYTADLDRGVLGARGADIWFQAETRRLLYIVPQNGARLGVGDRSARGYAGCSRARFTTGRVSLRDIPVGSYVCVKTNQGRISQFRVNAISAGSPKRLSIGYITWE